MKAIKFEGHNVIFAENQKEYQPLPAFAQPNGLVTFCMELDKEEIDKIVREKVVKLTVLTFGRPAQPIRVTPYKPEFPVSYKLDFVCNPAKWQPDGLRVVKGAKNKKETVESSPATFGIALDADFIKDLEQSGLLWITTSTFGTPLQPIRLQL